MKQKLIIISILAVNGVFAAPQSRPVLAVLLGEGTAMRVEWETQPEARYQVQASPDKLSWVNVGPVRLGSGHMETVPVSISGGRPHLRIVRIDNGLDLPRPKTEIIKRGREYRLRWTTVKGGWYQVQGSEDEIMWGNVGDVRHGSGQMDFMLVDVLGNLRFYRVVLLRRDAP
jgi:hypothetical protein|tara:strand:+ start:91 stop:606 length:516 start_codon:yes stop_codon:yes gene_type:complete